MYLNIAYTFANKFSIIGVLFYFCKKEKSYGLQDNFAFTAFAIITTNQSYFIQWWPGLPSPWPWSLL